MFLVPDSLPDIFKFLRSFPPIFSHVLAASRMLLRAEVTYTHAGQCSNGGIGGDGEYYGGNGAQLDHINVFYHEASGGKCVPRAVLFDLELGVIDAARASPLGKLFCPDSHVNQIAGKGKLGQGPLHRGWARFF